MSQVSVIMSVYNSERFLLSAIKSVLNQTLSDFEFLIMDDGSTDRSFEIIKEMASQDKRIKFFHHKNQGLAKSLNILIKKSKGEYIARMDADDLCFPERLEKQSDFLDNNPKYAMAVSGVVFISENGYIISGKRIVGDSDAILQMLLVKNNPLTHGTAMLRKSALERFSMPYRLRYGQDYDLWLRMLKQGLKIGAVKEMLYIYRSGSALQLDINKNILRNEQMDLLINLFNKDKLNDDVLAMSELKQIYTKYDAKADLHSELSDDSERLYLKSLLINNNFRKLRSETIRRIKTFSIKKTYLIYLLLSFIPKKISLKFLDMALIKENNAVEKNILTEELLRDIKRLNSLNL